MGRASRRKRERRSGVFPLALELPQPRVQVLPEPPVHHPKPQKISAALIELVEPYLFSSPDPGLDEARTIVGLGALAWNLSLLPKPERVQKLSEMLQDPNIRDPELLLDLLQALIERKRELFPDDTRRIMGWQVEKTRRNSFNVTAMCTG